MLSDFQEAAVPPVRVGVPASHGDVAVQVVGTACRLVRVAVGGEIACSAGADWSDGVTGLIGWALVADAPGYLARIRSGAQSHRCSTPNHGHNPPIFDFRREER